MRKFTSQLRGAFHFPSFENDKNRKTETEKPLQKKISFLQPVHFFECHQLHTWLDRLTDFPVRHRKMCYGSQILWKKLLISSLLYSLIIILMNRDKSCEKKKISFCDILNMRNWFLNVSILKKERKHETSKRIMHSKRLVLKQKSTVCIKSNQRGWVMLVL